MKKLLIASAVALALGTSAVQADDTSSAIRGSITTPSGQPAANTTITVTHMPTGVVKQYVTNNAGAFNARGLRVGGPYKILIDSDKFEDEEITDVYLELGNPFILNESLEETGDQKIVITASASDYRYPNSGSNSVFGKKAIEGSPSMNRDIKDVLRRNPLISTLDNNDNAMTVAGNNPRYNSITVDGIRQDDDFGLNGNGYPTQRSPISIDAVEQISVSTNPFSVKEGGFSGAGISVVTKSGTNEFDGRVFYEFNDSRNAGDLKDDNGEEIPFNFEEKTLGFSVGGPLIKDKLFFFANYEKFEAPSSFSTGPSDYVSGNPADVTTADANEVIRIARDVYGVDPGNWTDASVEEDEKKLLKIDWDINQDHRLSFTYQETEGEKTANNDGNNTLNLSSHWYTRGDALTAYSMQLFSDWNAAFSTQVRVANKEVRNKQVSNYGFGFGDVTVRTGSGSVALGSDRSRHANRLSNDNNQISFNGDYLLNDHTISFGIVMDEVEAFNIYIPDSLGTWNFDSLADFENRTASRFDYQNADSNNVDDGAAAFAQTTTALYIGDQWDIDSDLTLTYGLRYESFSSDDAPRLNPNFVARYGFDNTASFDGKSILLPRFGFNWTATDKLTLSGGLGKYSGGKPNVWLSNAYTNDGLTIVSPNLSGVNPDDYLTNVDITQVDASVLNAMSAGDGNATPIDHDFDLPSHWQYSLAANYIADLGVFGNDWELNAEVIFKEIEEDVKWVDLARVQTGTTVSGAPIYSSYDPVTNNSDHYDLMLTNSKGGESTIFTFSMDKSFDSGIDLNFSYTNQDVKDRVPGTSSTAESNYQYTGVIDRNNPEVATAAYQVEHRLALNLDYKTEIFEGYTTTFGLFMERVSGRPYSWSLGAFRDGDFGDQGRFNGADSYLPYIPTGPNDPAVDFDCSRCLSYGEMMEHIQNQGISSEGGYMARNDYRSPWKTNIDLYISQELPGFSQDHSSEVYLTIDNFINLIHGGKGRIESNRFGESTQILFDYDLNDAGQYQYQEPFGGYNNGSPAELRELESIWRLKLGFRYNF